LTIDSRLTVTLLWLETAVPTEISWSTGRHNAPVCLAFKQLDFRSHSFCRARRAVCKSAQSICPVGLEALDKLRKPCEKSFEISALNAS